VVIITIIIVVVAVGITIQWAAVDGIRDGGGRGIIRLWWSNILVE